MHRLFRAGLRAVHRFGLGLVPPMLFARRFAEIPGRIHIGDRMLRSDAPEHVRHYLDDARSAMANLEESLTATGRSFDDVEACLDFAAGYGRVTRHLVLRLGRERVTVGDVDPCALRFCAREFGVATERAPADVRRLALSGTYDLIFVGSLLTHLRPAAGLEVLTHLEAALRGGRSLLVFSTQGESCLAHLDWYGEAFQRAEALYRAAVAREGVCFVPYPRQPSYGITIHARRWIETTMTARFAERLRPVRYCERGWDEHQDVWAYARVP